MSARAGAVLVVDDDPDLRHLLRSFLAHAGHEVLEANSGPAARALLPRVDAVFLDVMMPEENGLEVLEHIRSQHPHLGVVMVTASHQVADAVRAMKMGAFDYLQKPVRRAELLEAARGAVALTRTRRPAGARGKVQELVDDGMVFGSPAMQSIMDTMIQVAGSAVPVLITGESGTGKSALARYLHRKGQRSGRPFVRVRCGGVEEAALEAELFGAEAGGPRAAGACERAADGTLHLVDVDQLPAGLQYRILRLVQDREFTRGAQSQANRFAARVVASTSVDLPAQVKAGRFRSELFYRLDVIGVTVPPVRERLPELRALAEELLRKAAAESRAEVPRISDDAVEVLQGHGWPGNLRELDNVLRRALLSGSRELHATHLKLAPAPRPGHVPAPAEAVPTGPEPVRRLSEHQAELMMRALQETRGNVAEAARRLGIGRATFYRRAKRWGLPI